MKTEVTVRRRVAQALLLGLSFVFVLLITFGNVARVFALDALTPMNKVTNGISYTGANNQSHGADMSSDGRYVVFASAATNLIDGQTDSNGFRDIFRYDRQTGTTVKVSTDSSGVASNGESYMPVVSTDGRYIAFHSLATNLVASDTNGVRDIFLKDVQTGTMTRVSTDSSATQANGVSYYADISDDGRYIAFQSGATNLVASDTNGRWDVFVKDTQTGTTTRVSTTAASAQATGGNTAQREEGVSMSADGRYVAFSSTATNLVAGDTNAREDVFVKDTQTGAIVRASTDSLGAQVNNNSNGYVFVSNDGRYVAFRSEATNLVAGDTNTAGDVFWKDTQTGTVMRVSTDSSGVQTPNNLSGNNTLGITADGRYVLFGSTAANLVASDTNSKADVFIKDTQTGTTSLVSALPTGAISNGTSISPFITFGDEGNGAGMSADGRYVTFHSDTANFVSGDMNDKRDIFIKDRQTAAVSLASPGTFVNTNQANGIGYDLAISANGRYVVYESWASNHVSGDTNNEDDIFLFDTQTGTTTRMSTNSSGAEANSWSEGPSISASGRYIAFASGATNLVAGDTNNKSDIFVKDTQTGVTVRASTDSSGAEGTTSGFYVGADVSISADGRYVAFASQATNLVAGDTNGTDDIFVKDTQTGVTVRASTDSSGVQGGSSSFGPSISADGRYVLFVSYATNLVASDTNGDADIFVKDTQTGVTTRVSTSSAGVEANDGSFLALSDTRLHSITGDGRYATFYSDASNLVPNDTNNAGDVFVKDLQTGGIVRASTDVNGAEVDDYSYDPSISDDGRYVTFWNYADNFVDDDTNGFEDTFIKDLVTGDISRVSAKVDGTGLNNYSQVSAISADGRYVAFWSFASDVVAGDTNGSEDMFLRANPFATILEDKEFSLDPGSTSGSVLSGATRNGQPISAVDYVLSIADDGGLTGVTINPDGTIVVPAGAAGGTYTVTYQTCEAAAPTYCQPFTVVLGISSSGLAETGESIIRSGLALLIVGLAVVVAAKRRRRRYSIR